MKKVSCDSLQFCLASTNVSLGAHRISNDTYAVNFLPPICDPQAILIIAEYGTSRTIASIRLKPAEYNLIDDIYLECATHTGTLCGDGIQQIVIRLAGPGELQINPSIFFLPAHFPNTYRRLPFVRPGELVDPRYLPQTQAVPKDKSIITASAVPKLIGFYKTGPMSTAQLNAMTFGRIKEPVALMMYMKANPELVCYEAGYYQFERCGCQPDALVNLCAAGAKINTPLGPRDIEGPRDTLGSRDIEGPSAAFSLEIKCSKSNNSFEGAHVAQCIWQLIATQLPFVDLIKYSEKGNVRQCKVLRIHRNPDIEGLLVDMCYNPTKYSDADREQMRKRLTDLIGDGTEIAVDDNLAKAYEAYVILAKLSGEKK